MAGFFAALSRLFPKGAVAETDPKYLEVAALPDGIKVVHSPTPCHAIEGGPSGSRYSWIYTTEVITTGDALQLVEFGVFNRLGGRWIFTMSGEPFTPTEFALWYSCAHARLLPGESYTDPDNWSGHHSRRRGPLLWYYIAHDAWGRKVKGMAEQQHFPALH